ncbi:NADH-quinone oxidoreductase subunit L [Congregibacter variabilis]|uniref:Probable inorganic carbon transporter subunit DabB n=1 Tax=Congregibacter variabilis TaxID=3081200 RepID=A0ABZ0I4R9_9GAMM|nr:NADH-quinone oxidoreductase subunit L [Congregibacter sp. IMCC43200]
MSGNWSDLVFLSLPLAYICSAILAPLSAAKTGWRMLNAASLLILLVVIGLPFLPAPESGFFGQRAMQMTVLAVVSFIGWIVTRFSAHYLSGEPGEQRFQRWLQLTLASVTVVVTTNHLGILIAAWIGISLSLHQLLMFYPERKRAALAAHKKFLFARLAESCLIVAAALLYLEHGTLSISDILTAYQSAAVTLTAGEQIAALLIASAAMVKCAQFPMHGWLIQVVECPTPVSALLHAGVINLGGFLILLMAPLMMHAELANWLLLIVAGLTCIAAALITMTRVSVKVLLAWSTVAQMGLMLVECALGQYGLALLHLVAHSCYKAYAFLSAGGDVEVFLKKQLAPARLPAASTLPLLFTLAILIIGSLYWLDIVSNDASLWLLLALFPIAMLSERSSTGHSASILMTAGLGFLLICAYLLQKTVFIHLAPSGSIPGAGAALWCALLFTVLLAAYWILRQRGDSAIGRRLYRNLYAGFYLDEWATRATLALWPAKLPQRAGQHQAGIQYQREKQS